MSGRVTNGSREGVEETTSAGGGTDGQMPQEGLFVYGKRGR